MHTHTSVSVFSLPVKGLGERGRKTYVASPDAPLLLVPVRCRTLARDVVAIGERHATHGLRDGERGRVGRGRQRARGLLDGRLAARGSGSCRAHVEDVGAESEGSVSAGCRELCGRGRLDVDVERSWAVVQPEPPQVRTSDDD